MSALSIMLTVWSVLAVCFLALLAYRGQITRYEEDQLFLTDTNSHEQHEQEEIVRKVNRLAPIVRLVGGACGLLTMGIVGTYAWDVWNRLH